MGFIEHYLRSVQEER